MNRRLQNQLSWSCQPPACLNAVPQLLKYNLNVTKRLDIRSELRAFHTQAQLPSTSPHNFLTEDSIFFPGLLPRTPWQITDRQRNLCSRHCFQRHRNLSQTLNARKALARESCPLHRNVTIWGALDAPTLARVGCFINRCVLVIFFFPQSVPCPERLGGDGREGCL